MPCTSTHQMRLPLLLVFSAANEMKKPHIYTFFLLILQLEDYRVKVSVPHTQVFLDLQATCFKVIKQNRENFYARVYHKVYALCLDTSNEASFIIRLLSGERN
jgi:hypothetical protein